ncbi:MAG: hypothetical protein EOO54_27675, partial [Haliea sp.]
MWHRPWSRVPSPRWGEGQGEGQSNELLQISCARSSPVVAGQLSRCYWTSAPKRASGGSMAAAEDGAPAAKGSRKRRKPVPKAEYTAPALEKGLDVLELLATLTVPVTPSQIAQRLGRSLSEVYRMVMALERRGYLIRPPGEEALVLSTQLYGLATLFPPFRRVVDAAQPIMNALALETSQAIHMAVLDGLNQRI